MNDEPPLKTRPVFLIILVAVIFILVLYSAAAILTECARIRSDASNKDKEMALLHAGLEKASKEKEKLSKSLAQMEEKISDLKAQKELFTSVIETLTKKGEDADDKSRA